jgi:DNA helicase-2/ATP-dependent DNA helicase PcrA
VVGDPDQSIYAWRGADIKNILDFEQDYPDARIVKLEQNYRSTKTILALADKLIANNSQRKKKSLWTENDQGAPAMLVQCQDEHDEARVVAGRFKELHEKEGIDWNGMAIFYRMNALSRVMEDALRRENIPYVMARGVEFYNRREIKDVLAYLRVVANPADEVSLARIINTPPRGIGASSLKQVQAMALSEGVPLFDALRRAGQVAGVSARAGKSMGEFVAMIEQAMALGTAERPAPATADAAAGSGRVRAVMEYIIRKSDYEPHLRKADKEKEIGEDATDNISELISSAAEYDQLNPEGSLVDYLAQISLVSDTDHLKGNGGAVTMMTLHAAKGLEFPAVAIIGMEEGILPHSRARTDFNKLEEERRLCFVGITRAEQHLLLSKAVYRTIRGLRERTVSSPFLGELPPEHLQVIDRTGMDVDDDDASRERAYEETARLAQRFRKGQLVRHPTLGIGRIAEVSQIGQQTRAIVEFNTAGRKTLILEFARLEAIGG